MIMKESNSDTVSVKMIIDFLMKRESYPHSPENVQHIQTHISNVFIAPPYVYKTKKRVDFGFLDYSTLEKRKHYCEQEVELNRRLCSEIYIGVESIVRSEHGLEFASSNTKEGGGEIVDYAVKMKLLDERYFLHSYIKQNTLTHRHLDLVADKLAEFYKSQLPDKNVSSYGEIEKIRFNTDENFQQTEQFVGNTISREGFGAITYFTNRYLDHNGDLFHRRIEENRIVDGHGDLHLEHIHISPGAVCIYDCIEFSDRFRCGDQAADLAFLSMDLEYSDRWDDSRYFIDQMAEKLGDPKLTDIIDFYKCYRAYVKGKVKSMKSTEVEVEEDDRNRAANIASVYFNLSLRYALIGSRPLVIICMGRIGTGKSTLAEHLGKTLDMDVFSSDRVRKDMAGLALHERPPDDVRKEIYSADMSRKTYQALLDSAIKSVEKGKSIILDATFSQYSGRRNFVKEFESIGADYLFIEAIASDVTIKLRLKKREDNRPISDARLEDFEMLTERYDKPDEIEASKLVTIDTGKELSETIYELYHKLIDFQFTRNESGK
jgi:aminoglycoside phosphotransferase family enzyme/predicted kinase